MSRLPRYTTRVKPPLRGRAATRQYRGNFAPVASVRRPLRPYGSGIITPPIQAPPHQEVTPPVQLPESPTIHPPKPNGLVKLYRSLGKFLRGLDQPWQWLVVLVVIMTSLLLLERLI